ncbi:hypothetical protein A9762_12240 [Pandoraea sp. ISTKB]|nr:hypothetical protein A9762_12240 [Pandoraea sp. ISTKB]
MSLFLADEKPFVAVGAGRQQALEADVQRLKEVVASVQRKFDAGSDAVTAELLAARQRELINAQDELAKILEERSRAFA